MNLYPLGFNMLDKESLLLHPKYHKRGIGKVTQNLKYMLRKATFFLTFGDKLLFQPTIHQKSLTKGYWDPKRGKRSNFVKRKLSSKYWKRKSEKRSFPKWSQAHLRENPNDKIRYVYFMVRILN